LPHSTPLPLPPPRSTCPLRTLSSPHSRHRHWPTPQAACARAEWHPGRGPAWPRTAALQVGCLVSADRVRGAPAHAGQAPHTPATLGSGWQYQRNGSPLAGHVRKQEERADHAEVLCGATPRQR
jgi:hypothetical protein